MVGEMIDRSKPADAQVHALCITLSRRCVDVISAILRPEERRIALEEFYEIARELLDKPAREEEI